MYRVIMLMNDPVLERELRSLSVWKTANCFEISESTGCISEDELFGYELIIADTETGLEILQRTRRVKKLRVVLCSREGDFEIARQGIIFGAYDYITLPFDLSQIHSMLTRAENELEVGEIRDMVALEQLKEHFYKRDKGFYSHFQSILQELLAETKELTVLSDKLDRFYRNIRQELSDRYRWLELYIGGICESTPKQPARDLFDLSTEKISSLFTDFCELYPHHNEQLETVISTILNYPESDLRQKTLSAQLHINTTYLSTVFLAQTGIRFVEYINTVKLKRAARLLTNTDLSITEVAQRLGYKDNSYFSRLFTKKFGLTPAKYRMPPNYDFQI